MATVPEKEAVVAPARRQGVVTPIVAYRARSIARRAVTYAVLILLALVTIFPLVWMLSTSVKDPQDVFSGSLLPTTIRLSNYQQVWIDVEIPRHFVNSLFVAVMTVAIVVAASTLAGYAFARFEFPARDVVFYIFLASLMIPGQVI